MKREELRNTYLTHATAKTAPIAIINTQYHSILLNDLEAKKIQRRRSLSLKISSLSLADTAAVSFDEPRTCFSAAEVSELTGLKSRPVSVTVGVR